jgi:hypothetical protein
LKVASAILTARIPVETTSRQSANRHRNHAMDGGDLPPQKESTINTAFGFDANQF